MTTRHQTFSPFTQRASPPPPVQPPALACLLTPVHAYAPRRPGRGHATRRLLLLARNHHNCVSDNVDPRAPLWRPGRCRPRLARHEAHVQLRRLLRPEGACRVMWCWEVKQEHVIARLGRFLFGDRRQAALPRHQNGRKMVLLTLKGWGPRRMPRRPSRLSPASPPLPVPVPAAAAAAAALTAHPAPLPSPPLIAYHPHPPPFPTPYSSKASGPSAFSTRTVSAAGTASPRTGTPTMKSLA
jgi:hypothetical protein